MKNTDVRCGNWVKLNDGNYTTIQPSSLNHINEYSEIELTEEWLVKFGFEENFEVISSTWHNEVKSIRIEIIQDSNGFNSIVGAFGTWIEINHVHQLQNLYFALTGEELTLK